MRPNPHAVVAGQRHGGSHHIRIARMETTGDIGGGHNIQQCGVVAHGPGAKAFAHIRVEIDSFCLAHIDHVSVAHVMSPDSKGSASAETTPLTS